MTRKHATWAAPLLAAAFFGLAACSNTMDLVSKSQRFADQRNFYQAYWTVANATERYPNDPELQRLFWERRKDYLLERGEELLFREREQDAINTFGRVFALDPDNVLAKAGIARAKLKLAKRAVKTADTLRHEGKLEEALKIYNRALVFVPEYPVAIEGIKKVNKKYKDRSEKAQKHYVLGSRARSELPPSNKRGYYHGGLAKEMDPSLEKATRLQKLTGRQIAAERFENAQAMIEKGKHSAALAEMKSIQALWPDYPKIAEHIKRLEVEVKALAMCREAEMVLRKKEFDRADKMLAEAFDLAVGGDVKAVISGVMRGSKRRRYEEEYLKARDLQVDWKLDAALAAFKEIQKAFKGEKGGFKDVDERIEKIGKEIAEATDAWKQGQKAEKAKELKKAIGFYKEALAVYPGFKGLNQRIQELEAKL